MATHRGRLLYHTHSELLEEQVLGEGKEELLEEQMLGEGAGTQVVH